MGHKIADAAADSFFRMKPFSRSNTKVVISESENGERQAEMLLFANPIAQHDGKDILLTDAGWATVTTQSRLNGILYHPSCQTFFSLYNNVGFIRIRRQDYETNWHCFDDRLKARDRSLSLERWHSLKSALEYFSHKIDALAA